MARQSKAQKLAAMRIQSAVYGFVIPMMSIPALYRKMEAALAGGASQEELKAVVAAFPGVEESGR